MESKPIICVSICEPSINALEAAMVDAGLRADLVEVRLDCLDQTTARASFVHLGDVLKKSPIPVILTYRPAQQGGKRELDNRSRLVFWLFNRPTADCFLDMELDLARNLDLFEFVGAPDWNRVICSHHDFNGMPADLERLYRQLASTPARILKIAAQADDAIDCLPIFQLLDRARAEGRELIAIAMGNAGLMTRILGPSRGAYLTYASSENDNATAPGQITAAELLDLYRIDHINQQTEIFGVIGLPVSHSLSPLIHNAAFAAANRNAVYIPFEVRDLPPFMGRMVQPRTREIEWRMRGLSVTAPHKLSVTNHLDWIEPTAREIGAVNTILIDEHGLSGYNTDSTGFLRPLMEKLGTLAGLRCAVMGAGGAANAAVWSLKHEGAEVTVFGRSPENVEILAKRFDVERSQLEGARLEGFDVIVNATPLGTSGPLESETPVNAAQLRGARLAYDLVYNPVETPFLREARAAGCQTIGGLEMFIAQAEDQFQLWTGLSPSKGVMRAAADLALIAK